MLSKTEPVSLARQERELAKPKNWGEITYWRLHERFGPVGQTSNKRKCKPLAPKKKVAQKLLEHAVSKAPLDGTSVLQELSELEQYDFFTRYPNCETLILQNWSHISDHVLRAIAITMGESLIEVDMSDTNVWMNHFEILLGRVSKLKVLRLSRCPKLDSACMNLITQICHKSLTELYVDECPLFRVEPLLWMCGCVGLNSQKLSRLRVLDLARTPVEDTGLEAVASGCHLIRYLNLEECMAITDRGVAAVCSANKHLKVLNTSGCLAITSKSLVAIAPSCRSLLSLNVSRCSRISDNGVEAIGKFCSKLQAINLAGLRLISEGALFALASRCPGIMLLNVTGCEEVTPGGLKALVQGMHHVEEALTFMGFKPADNHIEKKLTEQLLMIRETAANKISGMYRNHMHQREMHRIMVLIHRDKCVRRIQDYMTRYMLRVRFYYKWRDRVKQECSLLIQRVYRGYRGRIKASFASEERQRRVQLTPHCIMFQRMFRGNQSRKKNRYIADVVREMYERRRREAEVAVVVRLQTYGRNSLAQRKLSAWREMMFRRREDEWNAALVLQNMVRTSLSKGKVHKMLLQKQRIDDMRHRSAARIQAFYRASKGKYTGKLSRQEMIMVRRKREAAVALLVRVIRGHFGRQKAQKLRIQRTLRHCAAREIQRMYRGRRVIHWRDMRMNIIASFVLDRQYIERMDRMRIARTRYQEYLEDVRRDSASESDDIDEDALVQWAVGFDKKLNAQYWFNVETQETTYEEPEDEFALQKSLVGARVKILWVAQDEWFEGTPTKYHTRKQRYRVEYDDGDHEWINIDRERERVQVQLDNGSWVMFSMWQPPLLVREMEKKSLKAKTAEAKAEAYRDARQWRLIADDMKDAIMFISDITGAIRTGVPDAMSWVIQDDGFGYPCFLNVDTGETVAEDPRFLSDVGEDVQMQREFVMQELRYAVYFCKDMMERYENAVYLKNTQKVNYQLATIAKSSKPKLLTAFLLRAKALYKQVSVVDKPMDENIRKELEYATWLAGVFSELIEKADQHRIETEQGRRRIINSITKTSVDTTAYSSAVK